VVMSLSASVTSNASQADFLVLNFGNDWLTNMHEISFPAAVNWLTMTPFLGGLLFLLSLCFLRILWRTYCNWCDNLYRRQAHQKLLMLDTLWAQPIQRVEAAQGLAQLIRQVALTAWPGVNVTDFLGDVWLNFLRTSSGRPDEVPSLLSQLSYLPKSRIEQLTPEQWKEMVNWADQWILGHRVPLRDSSEVPNADI